MYQQQVIYFQLLKFKYLFLFFFWNSLFISENVILNSKS